MQQKTLKVLHSTASESLGKTRHESQSLLSLQTEKYDRTVRPVLYAHSSSYSEWNVDKTWSSQEWKSDELMEDGTGQPFVASWARTHEFQSSFSHEKTMPVIFFKKKKKFTMERGHPLFAFNEGQGHSNSSLETTKKNWNCGKDPDHSWIG